MKVPISECGLIDLEAQVLTSKYQSGFQNDGAG